MVRQNLAHAGMPGCGVYQIKPYDTWFVSQKFPPDLFLLPFYPSDTNFWCSNIVARHTSSRIMESLLKKFDEPDSGPFKLPYRLEHILGLIDECRSLIDDWEADKTLDPEAVAQKLEMIEAMAFLCDQYYRWGKHPQGKLTIVQNEQRAVEAVQNITTQMRSCLFSLSGLPDLASLGICQHCMRVVRQALLLREMKREIKGGLRASQIPSIDWIQADVLFSMASRIPNHC